MEVLKAFGYVALGMGLQWAANRIAWLKYYEGKREAAHDESKRKLR